MPATFPSSPVAPDQTPARTWGEQRRRDIRHRVTLRRELDAACDAFRQAHPNVFDAPIPF